MRVDGRKATMAVRNLIYLAEKLLKRYRENRFLENWPKKKARQPSTSMLYSVCAKEPEALATIATILSVSPFGTNINSFKKSGYPEKSAESVQMKKLDVLTPDELADIYFKHMYSSVGVATMIKETTSTYWWLCPECGSWNFMFMETDMENAYFGHNRRCDGCGERVRRSDIKTMVRME